MKQNIFRNHSKGLGSVALCTILGGLAALTPAGASQFVPKVSDIEVNHVDSILKIRYTVNLDSLELKSSRQAVFTPLLCSERDTLPLAPVIVNGRRAHIKWERQHHTAASQQSDKEPTVIRRKNGKQQSVTAFDQVAYQPWMKDCNITLVYDLCGCGDLLSTAGQEIWATKPETMQVQSPVEMPKMAMMTVQAEEKKVRHYDGHAYLTFPVNQITIVEDLGNNHAELDKILASVNVVREDKNTTVTGISIHGYASPEGSYSNNARLAKGRAEALRNYVAAQYPFAADLYTVESTPEDWAGLATYVTDSLHNADVPAIMAIINSDMNPDERDRMLSVKYPETYRYLLKHCYPALRRSDYRVTYEVRPFTLDEIREVIKTKPEQLSVDEMYRLAATYPEGCEEYDAIITKAADTFPDNAAANLNAAYRMLKSGRLDKAATYLDRAGNGPEAANGRTLLQYLRNGGTMP